MTHLNDKIAEFVYEELAPVAMNDARTHLAECGACRNEVEAFQRTHMLLKASPDVEPPRRVIFESEKPRAVASWWGWLSPAAAAVAASLLTALLLRPGATVNPPAAPTAVTQQAPAAVPAVTVDYGRIISEIRASQEKWLEDELQRRDADQSNDIQRVRTELAYLGNLQRALYRSTIENTASIQALSPRSESQD